MQNAGYAFTAAQRTDPQGYWNGCLPEDECHSRWLYTWSGDIDELDTSNGDFYEIFHTAFEADDRTSELRGFAVIGNETRYLPSAGPATYNGTAGIDLYDEAYRCCIYEREGKSHWRSRLTLTADFDSSTLSGRLDNWRTRAGGEDDYSAREGLVMTIPETRFDASGFTGRFSIENSGGDDIAASYEGSFYGPDVDSVAGTISAGGRIDGKSFAGIGWFGADKDR